MRTAAVTGVAGRRVEREFTSGISSGQRLVARRWGRALGCVAGLALVALLAVLPSTAAAYTVPPEQVDDALGLLELGGTGDVPGLTPSDVAQQWYVEEHRPYPNAPASEALHRELSALRQRTGLLPRLAPLGRFALGGVGGLIAWEVGTRVLSGLFPGESEPVAGAVLLSHFEFRDNTLTVSTIYETNKLKGPVKLYMTSAAGVYFHTEYRGGQWTCGGSRPAPPVAPEGAESLVTDAGTVCGTQKVKVIYFNHLRPGEFSPDHGPGGTPTYVPTTTPTYNPGVPASKAQAEQLMQNEFATGEYPLPELYLKFLNAPEEHPNPLVTQEDEDHRCDRGDGPTYQNPGGNVDPDPFDFHLPTPFNIANRPPSGEGVAVYLHEGTTHWVPGRHPEIPADEQFIDDWGGWGYRHIAAKHGWSQLDYDETVYALSVGQPAFNPASENYDYVAPVATPGNGGVACIRTVAIDFEPDTGDPRARGVVTSFNAVVP